MHVKLFFALCSLAFWLSCTGQQNQPKKDIPANEVSVPTEDELLREMGLLLAVEDAGYPYVNLEIDFPERGFKMNFLLNLEEVKNVNPSSIYGWVGRYIQFEYTSVLKNALLDVRLEGKSLLGVADEDLPEGLEKISGVLDCDEALSGDTPGLLSITDPHEASLEFECFIIQELIDAKGQLVEGYFETRVENRIRSIKVLKK